MSSSSSSSKSLAKSSASAESAFLSLLSVWKLSNQELDSLSDQIASESSRLDELSLLSGELSRLEPAAVMHRMVGPLLSPISVEQATADTQAKSRRISDEKARLQKRQQQLAAEQQHRRAQLQTSQQRLPNMPDAIFEL